MKTVAATLSLFCFSLFPSLVTKTKDSQDCVVVLQQQLCVSCVVPPDQTAAAATTTTATAATAAASATCYSCCRGVSCVVRAALLGLCFAVPMCLLWLVSVCVCVSGNEQR